MRKYTFKVPKSILLNVAEQSWVFSLTFNFNCVIMHMCK